MLAAMTAEEEASALLGMTQQAQTRALTLRRSLILSLLLEERLAALHAMAPQEKARVLMAMSPEMREQVSSA